MSGMADSNVEVMTLSLSHSGLVGSHTYVMVEEVEYPRLSGPRLIWVYGSMTSLLEMISLEEETLML